MPKVGSHACRVRPTSTRVPCARTRLLLLLPAAPPTRAGPPAPALSSGSARSRYAVSTSASMRPATPRTCCRWERAGRSDDPTGDRLETQPAPAQSSLPSERSLEWYRGICELVGARAHVRRDQLARRHLVLRRVDGVDGDELAAAQVTGAEAARGRRAAQDHGVVAMRDADDDELEIELVRPEPRQLVVRGGRAEQVERDGAALLEGVVDRFQAQVPPVPAVEVARAVSRGVDRLVGGAAVHVRHDAVLALDSSRLGELVRW